MARLLKSQKDSILTAVLSKTFKVRNDKLIKDKEAFALEVYDYLVTKEVKDYMASSPVEQAFPFVTELYIRALHTNYDGRSLKLKNAKPIPYCLYGSQGDWFNDLHQKVKDYLINKQAKLVERKEGIDKDRSMLMKKTLGVLNSVTTDKKLLEVWPEAIKYMDTVEVIDNLPMVTSGELNSLITIFEGLGE